MKRYQLLQDGTVKDVVTGENGIHPGAWQWDRVKVWLDEGNEFLPVKPSEFHILQDDQWVIDKIAERTAKEEAAKEESKKQSLEIVKGYSEEEQTTWLIQEIEAREFLKDKNAPCIMIRAIAQNRGITVDDLATRIIINSDNFKLAMGTIIGIQQKKIDDLYKNGNGKI